MVKPLMAVKTKPDPPIRWTMRQAGREFGLSFETVRRKLSETHQEPGADGCFSTKQLLASVYGSLYAARLRTQNEQAEKLRIQNEVSLSELLRRPELMTALAQIADAIKSRIMTSELSRVAKEDILRDI